MNLEYKNGLLYTSIQITYEGKTVTLDNIVVDTGASYCIFEPLVLKQLGITTSNMDEIETFYGVNDVFSYIKRTVDNIRIDNTHINDVEIYVGTVSEEINGLLGLDVLISAKATIDLSHFTINSKAVR